MIWLPLIVLLVFAAVITIGAVAPTEPDPPAVPPCQGDCVPRSQLVAAQKLAARRLRGWNAANRHILRLRARWRPSVDYAIALASRVEGVSKSQMRVVASCESHFDPYATNGRYKGIFQLGWSPFGFSPYEPLANALSAAQTVRHDGSWRQWQCKPG